MKNKKIKIPKKINIFDLYTSLEFQEIIRSKKKKKKKSTLACFKEILINQNKLYYKTDVSGISLIEPFHHETEFFFKYYGR